MSPTETTSTFDEIATRLHGDWRSLLRTGANVLVTAPGDMFDAFGQSSRGTFKLPVACVRGIGPIWLQPLKTLIIVDLHLLGADQQRSLMDWIADPANADTQIISFSPTPLFRLVQDRLFDPDLFYHLNTIHLDLLSPDDDDYDGGDLDLDL